MASPEFSKWWARFSETGNIAPIALGMTRDQVRDIFGKPDDFSVEKLGVDPGILKYESLEFHFGPGVNGLLLLIYMDTETGVIISISRFNNR